MTGFDIAEAGLGAAPARSPGAQAWRRLRRHRLAMAGLIVVVALGLASIVGPGLLAYPYDQIDYGAPGRPGQYQRPSRVHWFGTDELGRDLLTRCLHGARISLVVGVAASLISLCIGVTYGGISGYAGGRTDAILMRLVEVIYGVPLLLMVILLMVVLEPGLTTILLALGLTFWLKMARIVRGQTLSVKENDYVMAARGLGVSPARILWRHILPNTAGPIIVTLTLTIPEAIFVEAFLSLIGLGVSAPRASLGTLVAQGYGALGDYPHLFLFPAALISLLMLGFNFLGDGLRDALDPNQRDV